MSRIFRKNLHQCFSKIRCLPTSQCPPLTLDDDEEDDKFEFQQKHLNSLYNNKPSLSSSSSSSFSSTTVLDELFTSTSSSSDVKSPDFPAIFSSKRLFVSSPGHSNSILESLPSSGNRVVPGGVPVNKYSPNPYADFRASMQEMLDARHNKNKEWKKHDVNDDGLFEYLQELLLCYLNLNPKHTHKFIIEAFADILLSLMST